MQTLLEGGRRGDEQVVEDEILPSKKKDTVLTGTNIVTTSTTTIDDGTSRHLVEISRADQTETSESSSTSTTTAPVVLPLPVAQPKQTSCIKSVGPSISTTSPSPKAAQQIIPILGTNDSLLVTDTTHLRRNKVPAVGGVPGVVKVLPPVVGTATEGVTACTSIPSASTTSPGGGANTAAAAKSPLTGAGEAAPAAVALGGCSYTAAASDSASVIKSASKTAQVISPGTNTSATRKIIPVPPKASCGIVVGNNPFTASVTATSGGVPKSLLKTAAASSGGDHIKGASSNSNCSTTATTSYKNTTAGPGPNNPHSTPSLVSEAPTSNTVSPNLTPLPASLSDLNNCCGGSGASGTEGDLEISEFELLGRQVSSSSEDLILPELEDEELDGISLGTGQEQHEEPERGGPGGHLQVEQFHLPIGDNAGCTSTITPEVSSQAVQPNLKVKPSSPPLVAAHRTVIIQKEKVILDGTPAARSDGTTQGGRAAGWQCLRCRNFNSTTVGSCLKCELARERSQWQCKSCSTWVANDDPRCPLCSMWDGSREPDAKRICVGPGAHRNPPPSASHLVPHPPPHSSSGPAALGHHQSNPHLTSANATQLGSGLGQPHGVNQCSSVNSTLLAGGGKGGGKLRKPPQSWHCVECYYDNWEQRTTCNKCLKPRKECEGPDLGVKRKLPDPSKALLQISAEFAAGLSPGPQDGLQSGTSSGANRTPPHQTSTSAGAGGGESSGGPQDHSTGGGGGQMNTTSTTKGGPGTTSAHPNSKPPLEFPEIPELGIKSASRCKNEMILSRALPTPQLPPVNEQHLPGGVPHSKSHLQGAKMGAGGSFHGTDHGSSLEHGGPPHPAPPFQASSKGAGHHHHHPAHHHQRPGMNGMVDQRTYGASGKGGPHNHHVVGQHLHPHHPQHSTGNSTGGGGPPGVGVPPIGANPNAAAMRQDQHHLSGTSTQHQHVVPGAGGPPQGGSNNHGTVNKGGPAGSGAPATTQSSSASSSSTLQGLAGLLGSKFQFADLERAYASSRELRETAASQGIYNVEQLHSTLMTILAQKREKEQRTPPLRASANKTSTATAQSSQSAVKGNGPPPNFPPTVQTLRMTDTGQVIPLQQWNKKMMEDVDSLNTLFSDTPGGASAPGAAAGAAATAATSKTGEEVEKVMYEAILAKLKEQKQDEDDYDFDSFDPDPFLKSPNRPVKLENHPQLQQYGITGGELSTFLKFWSMSSNAESEICPRYHELECGVWICASCDKANTHQDRICTQCDEIRESTQWFCRHSCTWQNNDVLECTSCKKPRARCEATPEMEIFRIFGYKHQETDEGTTYEDLVHGMVCVAKRILKRYTIMEEKERTASASGNTERAAA
ncbi:unnamed protein product [Amoebophrya sp. A120]|nr:unnamed protein product [Amoebophrya sp. A120]|eukprot:GSA120T00000549001.1